MNLKEYQNMAKLIENSTKLLDERFSAYLKIYGNKKRFFEYKKGAPKLNAYYDLGSMYMYDEGKDLEQINIEFLDYQIDISFEKTYSGCNSDYESFSLPIDLILGSDSDFKEYLLKLEKETEVHNQIETEKYEKRIQEINDEKMATKEKRELAELNRLRNKYEGNK